jgi:hypothetical protein
VKGSCEHGNVPSGSIKFWEVLEEVAASQGGLSSMESYTIYLCIKRTKDRYCDMF